MDHRIADEHSAENPVFCVELCAIGFDVTCLLVTACMTYFCLGRILGLGIGTVLAAFTMGKGIALVGQVIDKYFDFVSVLSTKSEMA